MKHMPLSKNSNMITCFIMPVTYFFLEMQTLNLV